MAQLSSAKLYKNRSKTISFCSLNKGIGKFTGETDIESSTKKWNLLQEDISFPAAVLDMEKFHHNVAWMETFLSKFPTTNPILLAPHGKTSMMPNLFNQICQQASTWGLTLATATQVKVAHTFGVSKILMTNQLVGKRNMEIISEIMGLDENFEFLCIIDSPQNVNQLGQHFSERKEQLKVLLEYGPPINGRTGVRNETQEAELLSALKNWSGTLCLVGVEFFEGVLSIEQDVSNFIDFVTERTNHLLKTNAFSSSSSQVIITGSGSAWFDLVAEKLTKFSSDQVDAAIQIILRPGCYMIHDVGMYTEITSRLQDSRLMNDAKLKPALKIWAYIQSIAEKDLAIVGFGRRDAGNDCGFPKPCLYFRPTTRTTEKDITMKVAPQDWKIFRMMDQHSFMTIQAENDDVQVGDIVIFDIVHVCTTLDKWRQVVIIDNERDINVVDIYPTFF